MFRVWFYVQFYPKKAPAPLKTEDLWMSTEYNSCIFPWGSPLGAHCRRYVCPSVAYGDGVYKLQTGQERVRSHSGFSWPPPATVSSLERGVKKAEFSLLGRWLGGSTDLQFSVHMGSLAEARK